MLRSEQVDILNNERAAKDIALAKEKNAHQQGQNQRDALRQVRATQHSLPVCLSASVRERIFIVKYECMNVCVCLYGMAWHV